jgi:hypothetical protein
MGGANGRALISSRIPAPAPSFAGGKTAVLNLGTGDTAALQGPSHDPAQRLVEISKTVKGVTGKE